MLDHNCPAIIPVLHGGNNQVRVEPTNAELPRLIQQLQTVRIRQHPVPDPVDNLRCEVIRGPGCPNRGRSIGFDGMYRIVPIG
jgi:hypothetical protein